MGRLEWVVGVARVLPEESATIQQQLLKPRQLLSEVHNDHHREQATYERWRISFRSRPLQPAATSSVKTRKSRHARREFAVTWARSRRSSARERGGRGLCRFRGW